MFLCLGVGETSCPRNGTWTTMGLNSGFYGEKLVTNHLSYEAFKWV
jgi:hypothetical protein